MQNNTTAAELLDAAERSRLNTIRFYNATLAFEQTIGVIIPSIFAVVVFVGVLGNLLVIIVALNRQMRNSTNTLIIGLTISDLLFLTLCVPFTAIDYAYKIWVLPTWACNMINYLQHSSAYFSVWTLTLMAADRFLAVCYPVESMTLRNPLNTCMTLVVTYVIILLSQIQVAKIHGIYNYRFFDEPRSSCAILSIATRKASVTDARIYFFSFNFFGYVLPLSITCVFYYLMLKRLWYMPRPGGSKHTLGSVRCRPETIRAKRKVTRLVFCVVIIWAICWFPFNVCFCLSGILYPDALVNRYGKTVAIIQIVSQVLAYANSCLNPILYALVSDNFRKGFIRIISTVINKLTFGNCCERRAHSHSQIEATFYNSNRMSRTNSSHRTVTHALTESSSLLLKSPLAANSNNASENSDHRTPKPKTNCHTTGSLANRVRRQPKEHKRPQRVHTFDDISSA